MATVNRTTREINCKLVYYGPGMCGKTTNLKFFHQNFVGKSCGDLVSLATPGERTLFFDFLPVKLAEIGGYSVKFGLYTVPGQVQYNATRKLVLRGADGVVFVADSQWDLMDENAESLKNLNDNLVEYGVNLEEIPYIIQYNKRDLTDIAPIWYMQHLLNRRGVPTFEAVATEGKGVYETLFTLCRYVVRGLAHRLQTGVL